MTVASLGRIRVADGRAVAIEALVNRIDRVLTRFENKEVTRLQSYIQKAMAEVYTEIQQRWPKALKDVEDQESAMRYARAYLLLAELGTVYSLIGQELYEDSKGREYFERVYQAGVEDAVRVLDSYGPMPGRADTGPLSNQLATFIGPEWQAVDRATRIADVTKAKIQRELKNQVEQTVVEGLIRGRGVREMTRRLRAVSGMARSRAERLVRTESHRVYDEAHQASYVEAGVEYVQRIAVMDSRTCGYCAARAGMVYVLGEAPAALHPNDRCYMLPWHPDWVEAGIIDEDWIVKHSARARAIALHAGHKPTEGAAPFERMEGREPPTPLWGPIGGGNYTTRGKAVLGGAASPTTRDVIPPASSYDRIYRNDTYGYPAYPSGDVPDSEYVRKWSEGTALSANFPDSDIHALRRVAENWVRSEIGTQRVYFDGMIEDAVRQTTSAFEDMARRFPHLVEFVNKVTTETGNARQDDPTGGMPDDMWNNPEWTNTNGAYAPAKGIMLLNPLGLDQPRLESVFDPHFSPTGASIKSIVTHELAHALENTIANGPAAGLLPGLRQELNGVKKVSRYATTNFPEMFAETLVATLKPQTGWGEAEYIMAEFLNRVGSIYGWSERYGESKPEPTETQPSLFPQLIGDQ